MIDWTKPVRFIKHPDWPTRVLCTDADHEEYPVVVMVKEEDYEVPRTFTNDGREYIDESVLLENVPAKLHGWVNVYAGAAEPDGWVGGLYKTPEHADANACPSRVRRVEVREV